MGRRESRLFQETLIDLMDQVLQRVVDKSTIYPQTLEMIY